MDIRMASHRDYDLGDLSSMMYLSYAPTYSYDHFTGRKTFRSKKSWTVTATYVDGVLDRVLHLEHDDPYGRDGRVRIDLSLSEEWSGMERFVFTWKGIDLHCGESHMSSPTHSSYDFAEQLLLAEEAAFSVGTRTNVMARS